MNLKNMENILLKKSTVSVKLKGQELIKNNSVTNIQGKKIENFYHIYGKVKDENKEVRTHIQIDSAKNSLVDFKCTCYKYKLYKDEGHKYYCPHLVATSLRFLQHISNNMKKSTSKQINNIKPEKDKKIELQLAIKLHFEEINNIVNYYAQIKIGEKNLYLIQNINEFLNAYITNKPYKLNDSFIYNSKDFIFSEKNNEFINLLFKYKKTQVLTNKIKINKNNLLEFLESINLNEIVFKDRFLEYPVKIKKAPLPYIINLNEVNNQLVVNTEKNIPLSLDFDNRVLLFNRNIFILSKEESLILHEIIKNITTNNIHYFPENNFEILPLILKLNSITSKLNISTSVKHIIKDLSKTEFYFFKNKTNIYCNIYIVWNNTRVSILDNKNILIDLRDKLHEEMLIDFVKSFNFSSEGKYLKFLGNDYNLFDILGKNKLAVFGDIILGSGLENIKVYNGNDLYGTIYDDDFAIKLSYKFKGLDSNSFKEAFSAFKNKQEFYKTKTGDFINLLDTKVIELFNLIDILNLEKDLDKGMSYIDKSRGTLLYEAINTKNLDFIYDKNKFENINDKINKLNDLDLNIPDSLKLILRDYQLQGVKWLKGLTSLGFGGILADEMGLGKTIQTITFLSTCIDKTSLIIVPTSLIYNWKEEFLKFAPWIKVAIVNGSLKEREDIIKKYKDYDVLVTTYGKVKNDIEYYNKNKFDFIFLDEGQNIKNHTSQNSQIVKLLKANNKFVLSGTPIENNLLELWSIFDFIMPNFLYTKDEFEAKFDKENKNSLDILSSLIKPFILRRTKKQVAKDLPNKNEERVLITLNDKQKSIYNNYVKTMKSIVNNGNSIEIFSALTKLRLVCLHPKLFNNEYSFESSKFIAAHKIINDTLKENKKILIFSQFTSLLDLLNDELKSANINTFVLTGKTSAKERINLVNKFNSSNDVNVFLISLKAGGTGLNLTSAHTVIHFDPWWNPAVEDQASDRAHRIGQDSDVNIIKLIAKGTIEEKIILLQEEKKKLITDVLSGDISKNNLNLKTIQSLINTYI